MSNFCDVIEVPRAPVVIPIEEIECERVPPVYKCPLRYDVDVDDENRPALIVDLQGVLIHTHRFDSDDEPPSFDISEHEKVNDGDCVHFVRKDAELFLILAHRYVNVFIWSCALQRNVERRVQK